MRRFVIECSEELTCGEDVPELELHTRYIGLARDLGALICEMLAVDHQVYESFFELCPTGR